MSARGLDKGRACARRRGSRRHGIWTAAVCLIIAGCVTTPWAGTTGGYAGETLRARTYAHYLAATVYERRGQFERAAEELRKAISLSPDDAALRIALVRSYTQMADLDSALKACREAVKKTPDEPVLWIWLGGLCQRLERYDEAVSAYQQVVALEPDDPRGYDRLIRVAEQANDLVTLLDIFEQLVELLPGSAQFRFQLGYYVIRTGDIERARALVEEAVALEPGLAGAHSVLGLIYLDLDRNAEAIAALEHYTALFPDDTNARANLAGAYGRLGQFERALEILDELVGTSDAETVHHLARWYVLLRLERFGDVASAPALSGAPILSAVFNILARKASGATYEDALGLLDGLDGDMDAESRDLLEKIIFLYGKDSVAPFLIDAFKGLCGGSIESKRMYTLLGRAYMSVDRDEEAEAVFRDALERFGPDKWHHLYLGTIYERQNRPGDAEQHLKACLEIDPDDPEVMNFLGYMYAEENIHLDEAERLLKRALEIDPDNGFYLDSLGWVYYRKKDADRAVEFIRRAIIKMDNDDAVLRDHLGDAYALRGEYDKALAEWRRALRLDPKIEGVQDKIDRALRKKDVPKRR